MPTESHIAIIGDGPAALAMVAVLHRAGLSAPDVAVYGDAPHPLARLERYARAVGQRRMRSEGDGHLSPDGFPGLGLIDSWRRRTPAPVLAALFNLYTPSLDLLLAHTAEVARRCGFARCHVRARVGRLVRGGGARHGFTLEDERGALLGCAQHIVLALGHPGLRWPAVVGSWHFHPRVAHAYQGLEIHHGERVVVVGSGIAAAHAWLAALDAGASVTALHRSPLVRQQLNAPRCLFGAVGIDSYRRMAPEQRLALFRRQGGSFPWRLEWELQLARARRDGRFVVRHSRLEQIEAESPRPDDPLMLRLADGSSLPADRLVFATGFRTDPRGHRLVRCLVSDYGAAVDGGLLRVADDFTLPPISHQESVLAVMGALARWALPNADTFFGMKYAARRIAPML
jgi:hypothetical protein